MEDEEFVDAVETPEQLAIDGGDGVDSDDEFFDA